MNLDQKHSFLQGLQARAGAILLPSMASRVIANLKEMEASLTEESEKEMSALCQAARRAGPDSQEASALAEVRVFTLDNFVSASTNALAFFDTQVLGDSDVPYIENTAQFQIDVDYIGQDGRAKIMKALRMQQQYRVDLYTLSTPEFEYYLKDIYTGDVKTPSMAAVNIGRDVSLKLNALMWPFIKGQVVSSFGLTGTKQSRVYVPSVNVIAGNLPTFNKLVPSDNTTRATSIVTSSWRKSCMDAIIQYVESWGSDAFADGGFSRNVKVFIPSVDVAGLLQQITLTSFGNSAVEKILNNGGLKIEYAGYTFTLIGDNTLDPAQGMAYGSLDKPAGIYFTKPSQDQTFVDNSVALAKQNKERLSQSKVIGFGLPSNYQVNLVGVQYKTLG